MTISGFQSYTFSAVRLSMTVTPASAAPAAAGQTPAAQDATVDRVSLSPEATSPVEDPAEPGAALPEGSELPAAAPAPSVPPPSRAARRADALFTALDADKDGAITEDEFKDGALALLRQAGARRRIDDDSPADGRNARGLGRVERKLDKIFERVDRNDDGAIDKGELTAALSRGRGRRGESVDAPPPDAPPAGGVSISISVTYVSIAVQRYTSLQDGETTSAAAPAPVPGPAAESDAGSESETPALAA